MEFQCAHCGATADRPVGHVNRARERGLNLYCSRKCSGLGRRNGKTVAQKKAEKREYDKRYRASNLATIKAKKAAYFKRTYDPAKARVERERTMARHVEYCRRPEYKAWKSDYDRRRRDSDYGPFAEAARLAIDLNREIKQRSSNHEISKANGTLNKRQGRLREDKEAQRGRPRHRNRSDRHSPTDGERA